jgi:hypothetical protein
MTGDRYSEDHGTNKKGASALDFCGSFGPSTIGDQLRNDGWLRPETPTAPDGTPVRPMPCYPLAGNAGFDTDNDADDYNTAVYQQPSSITSSSGP